MVEARVPDDRDGQGALTLYSRVREAIIRGELRPGSTISQGDLAAAVDGSRTPLREALRMLAQDDLVVIEANRRIRIAPLAPDDLEDIQMARVTLEAMAVRVTVPTLVPEQVAELEGLLAQMSHFAEDQDFDRLEHPHRAFHSLLTSAVGGRNRRYLDLLHDHAVRYRREYALADEQGPHDRLREHRSMLDLVKAHDADAVADSLIDHYVHLTEYVLAHMEPSYRPDRLHRAAEASRSSRVGVDLQ